VSILASIHHVTRYDYDRLVTLGPQLVRLRPAPHSRTRIPSYSLKVTPERHFVNWQQDPHGNWLARFVFPEPTRVFAVTVDLLADMAVVNPFDFFIEPYAEQIPFAYPPEIAEDLVAYVRPEPAGATLRAFLGTIPKTGVNTVDFLVALNARLGRARSSISSAWSRASRSPRRRCNGSPDHVAIRRGFWCRFCAISASRRASSPDT
jgi:transglutaminase-like putative cysteine protease